VLGDMLELGPDEEELHRQVGERAGRIVDGLVTVGERARWIADGARAAGLTRVASAPDVDQAEAVVERELDPGIGDLLLVKGSRGVELDRLVATLTGFSDADRETG
jgi:UDP-N-acetylmuramoyl-tripeptide--D-alanyl-D-alanine ligase